MENCYLIIAANEIQKVDFTQLSVSSPLTCLYLDNKEKLLLKWRGEPPSFVASLVYKEGPYNRNEIKDVLKNRNPIILSLSTI